MNRNKDKSVLPNRQLKCLFINTMDRAATHNKCTTQNMLLKRTVSVQSLVFLKHVH